MSHQSLDTSPVFNIHLVTSKYFPQSMSTPNINDRYQVEYRSLCHIITILSSLPEARYCPFGENLTQRTTPKHLTWHVEFWTCVRAQCAEEFRLILGFL